MSPPELRDLLADALALWEVPGRVAVAEGGVPSGARSATPPSTTATRPDTSQSANASASRSRSSGGV
ncbi:MAG: hypothetical protein EON47_19450, partial [Acetobacteraceae bacterium]